MNLFPLLIRSDVAAPGSPAAERAPWQPLPWAGDETFKETIERYQTPILMAEYHAALPDPEPGEMHNVVLGASRLAGTVIGSGKAFSQNQTLGPYTEARGYQEGPTYIGTKVVMASGGGVCKLASLLYNVATISNLEILERHNHSKTVSYVPLGQDATVCYGVKDLRFKNNTAGPLVIWACTLENTLYLAIYGQAKPPQVTWQHEILKRTDFWTVYRDNSALPPGAEQIIIPGQDGYLIHSSLIIEADGRVEQKDLGEDWYEVLPQVVERGRD